MKSAAQFLAFMLVHEKYISSIKNVDIVQDPDQEFYLTFEQGTIQKSKEPYKKNIKDVLWGGVEEMYNSCLAGMMIMQGYVCVPIENGWIVLRPSMNKENEKEYQLQEESCTCDAFIQNSNQPCKHLKFRDWHVQYRTKISQIKKRYE